MKSLLALALAAILGLSPPALAAGFYTNGLPPAGALPNTYPFTGNETIPLDTNLPLGTQPQTESASLSQLAGFFSAGGSSFGPFPSTGTAIGAFNNNNMVYVGADSSHNLNVNCVVGCVAGTGNFNNNSDAVATSSINGQSASWLYGFNGTTWDRLRDDTSKYLFVDVGTWSAGPLAVSQSGTWNITNISGTVSLPTGAATSAIQNNVRQTVAPGTAATNSLLMGGVYSASGISLTNGQGAALQLDANGYVEVNIKAGAGAGGTSSSFAASFPSAGTAIGAYNGSNMVYVAADSSHNLQVNCTVGCSSSGGSSLADSGSFTQGTTSMTVLGGIFTNSPTTLSSGQGGAVQITSDRMLYTNLGKIAGTVTATGAGTANAGSQRVTVAQDSTTVSGCAPGTPGSPSSCTVTVQGSASGTGLPVAQSGTWNIAQITGTQTLPTGASTSALQSSVQGPVAPGSAASNSVLIGGTYSSSPPTFTNGQQGSIQLDSAGNMKMTCISGCSSSGGSSQVDATTFTQGTTSFTSIGGLYSTSISNLSTGQAGIAQLTNDRMLYVNVGKVGGNVTLTGTGAVGSGAQRVAVAQDTSTLAGSSPGTAGSPSSSVVSVQGTTSMTPVVTSVQALISTQSGVTITTGNTFQSAIGSSGSRKGCNIQYTGSSIGYVFFGATVSATKSASFQLAPGSSISCNVPGGVLTDNVAITSATTSDTFVVNVQ